jgi:MFS family permease
VYVISIVGTVIGTAFRPAQAALVPNLARSPEELTAANVTATTIESVGIFVGPALGGVLVATTSVSVTFLVAAALLLWSAILVGLVREPARESTDEPEEVAGFLGESVAGFRVIVADRRLRVLTGPLRRPDVRRRRARRPGRRPRDRDARPGRVRGGPAQLVSGDRRDRRRRRGCDARRALEGSGPTWVWGLLLWGVPLLLVGLWPEAWVAFAAFALVGIGNTIVDVAGDTLLQRAVPDAVLARAFAAMESVTLGAVALGSVAAPVLIDLIGGPGDAARRRRPAARRRAVGVAPSGGP